MGTEERKKNVPIYFYYLAIAKQKNAKDDSVYCMDQIVASFSAMLQYVLSKNLSDRKQDITASEKIVWLASAKELSPGNYDIIFKSAKYNHVRNEIDTETMEELGLRKRQQDGDEEKTHLCIRLAKGQHRFLAVHESNHYGISIKCIIDYLNAQFKQYSEVCDDNYLYTLSHEIMPGDDFLTSLRKAQSTSRLILTVSKYDLPNAFMLFAGREEAKEKDVDEDVEIVFKRPKGVRKIPENLIKQYYNDMQSNNKIKRISVKGRNPLGDFEAHTDLIKMKHYLTVEVERVTNEVKSSEFFEKAQEFIDETREK